MKLLTKMSSQKSWVVCCFFNFLIASLMGLLMRYVYLFPLNINYSFLLHAHSHVAMLGWAYLMIYVLIVRFFIPKEKIQKPIYNQLFWVTEFAVIGMMVTFPIQGYALFSIIFSTMHIVLSYVFCWLVWRDGFKDKRSDHKLLLAAILFMVFSTFGVWCLGPAVSMLGKQSAFYQIAIQFFLHFQFNGWFLFAVLALFLKQFEDKIEKKSFKIFFTLLIIATFLTVAFPVSWYVDNNLLSWINTIGVVLQLVAFVHFYKMLKPQINSFKANLDSTTKIVYGLALCSLFLKIGIQLLVLIPNLAEISHQIRSFIIGFIHLTTLGIITGFLLGVLIQNKLLSHQSYLLRVGIKCFILGYIATEILLFIQGGFLYFGKGALWGYYEEIFGTSVLIVVGLSLITASIIKTKNVRL
ncbi:membrane protein [Flavobacterium sp. JRM]|nr:membrane protein [Flavobacterium sp. JRM]